MTVPSRAFTRSATVLIFLALVFLPVAIPFPVLILACLALVWTRLEAGSLEPMGIRRRRPASTVTWGVGLAVAVTIFGEALQPLIEWFLGIHTDCSGYGALAGNAEAALRLLGFALVNAALGEEILFRGFLLATGDPERGRPRLPAAC